MEAVAEQLRQSKVVAGFSVLDADDAVPIAKALLAGGIDVIELTMRTPAALTAIEQIAKACPDMCIGVGTVLTPEQVVQVKNAGAHFAVAPGLNRRVVEAAKEHNLPFAPGIITPSELELAIELGCKVVKFFPAVPSGGVKYLKSLSAPYKHLNIQYFPLGGINSTNMTDFLALDNVCAVGGSWIVKQDLVSKKDWHGITANATAVQETLTPEPSSDTSYESDDGEWHPPMMNEETGLMHNDVYGTLTATASTITTPHGVARRFLEMIGEEKAKSLQLFCDVGCGKGIVVSSVAKSLNQCRAVGIDILAEQLEQASVEAELNGVSDMCTFVQDDFRKFSDHLQNVDPKNVLVYMYLIPKMVNNRDLRARVEDLIAQGVTFVTWSYHATPEWSHLLCQDKTYNIKVFQN
jgi:2-dehydro-3-deoxyphosphogluconate aldolase/(4S)-4-hydroxy-2-oxoglutarate aldolase